MLTWCIWKCSGCKSDGRLLYSTRLREGERLTETDTLFTLWQRLNSECSFDLSCIISHISTGTIRVYACVSQCICMILGIFKACLQGSSWYICWCQRQRWSAVKASLCLTHTHTSEKNGCLSGIRCGEFNTFLFPQRIFVLVWVSAHTVYAFVIVLMLRNFRSCFWILKNCMC